MRLIGFGMRSICIICCVIACAVFLFGYQSRAAANKMLGNMTYLTDAPYIVEKVTLVNGQYEQSYERGVSLYYHFQYNDQYVYGDFNQDGLKDAAVIIIQNEGGSGEFRSLAFLINDGTQLIHKQSVGLGDRVIINSLKERKGKVVIDMFAHKESDCMAGPTKRVKNVYDYLNPNPDLVPMSQQGTG